jgi:hypothetical protein
MIFHNGMALDKVEPKTIRSSLSCSARWSMREINSYPHTEQIALPMDARGRSPRLGVAPTVIRDIGPLPGPVRSKAPPEFFSMDRATVATERRAGGRAGGRLRRAT